MQFHLWMHGTNSIVVVARLKPVALHNVSDCLRDWVGIMTPSFLTRTCAIALVVLVDILLQLPYGQLQHPKRVCKVLLQCICILRTKRR